jgi:ATP-dependent Lon protease
MFHKIIYSYDSEETDPNFVSFIADDFMDNNKDIDNSVLPDTIPILPLRNTVIFPGSRLPISVGREKSLRLIKSLGKKQRYIGLVCQKDGDIENPEPDDLYRVGVIAEVMRVIELGNDNLSIIIQAKKRFEWDEMVETEPFFKAKYKIKESVPASKDDKEYIAILDSIRDTMIQMLQLLGEPPKELLQTLNDEAFLDMLVSYCATNLPFDSREKQELLNIDDEKEQAYRLLMILNREMQILELKMNIQMKTREDLNQQQKEYYLQQQLKTIQEELGGNVQQIEIDEFRKKAKEKKWSKEVAEIFEKEVKKLERLNPQSPDDSVIVPDEVKTSVPGAGRYRFVATRDENGRYAMVYVPVGRPFTVRMDVVSGKKVTAWWYNPRNGQARKIGNFSNEGTRTFVPPQLGENLDWVLVLDDAAAGFKAPGK